MIAAWYDTLKARLRRHQYDPGVLAIAVNPFYIARRGLRRAIRTLSPDLQGRLLDVGCGIKPYRDLFPVTSYFGLEVDRPESRSRGRPDVIYGGGTFPFADAAFDGILCNQVLEHIFAPVPFLRELHRVLRPDGLLLLTVPFVWDEHEQPFDFARYSSFGLAHLLEQGGFRIERHLRTSMDGRLLFQLLIAMIFKRAMGRHPLLDITVMLFVIAPINVIGVVLGRLIPGSPDLYLDHVVLARRLPDA